MDWVHRELRRKNVILQLLWAEYKQTHPEGYQYTPFLRALPSLGQQAGPRPGPGPPRQREDVLGLCRPDRARGRPTGEIHDAHVLVAVLGASNYTYADPVPEPLGLGRRPLPRL